jgi:hypothetical protein
MRCWSTMAFSEARGAFPGAFPGLWRADQRTMCRYGILRHADMAFQHLDPSCPTGGLRWMVESPPLGHAPSAGRVRWPNSSLCLEFLAGTPIASIDTTAEQPNFSPPTLLPTRVSRSPHVQSVAIEADASGLRRHTAQYLCELPGFSAVANP